MILKSTTTVLALIASITIILLWIIAAPRPNAKQPETTPTTQSPYSIQQRAENNVTVGVTPLSLTPRSKPTFQVEFETHSVELDFDVAKIAILADDQETSYGVPTWEGSPPGGHHRNGTLTFSQPLSNTATSLTLAFANIATVPVRTFSWQIPHFKFFNP